MKTVVVAGVCALLTASSLAFSAPVVQRTRPRAEKHEHISSFGEERRSRGVRKPRFDVTANLVTHGGTNRRWQRRPRIEGMKLRLEYDGKLDRELDLSAEPVLRRMLLGQKHGGSDGIWVHLFDGPDGQPIGAFIVRETRRGASWAKVDLASGEVTSSGRSRRSPHLEPTSGRVLSFHRDWLGRTTLRDEEAGRDLWRGYLPRSATDRIVRRDSVLYYGWRSRNRIGAPVTFVTAYLDLTADPVRPVIRTRVMPEVSGAGFVEGRPAGYLINSNLKTGANFTAFNPVTGKLVSIRPPPGARPFESQGDGVPMADGRNVLVQYSRGDKFIDRVYLYDLDTGALINQVDVSGESMFGLGELDTRGSQIWTWVTPDPTPAQLQAGIERSHRGIWAPWTRARRIRLL